MENALFNMERQEIDNRIRAHGLDPCSFSYRWQASEEVTRYVRIPGRVFGKYIPIQALALYPKDREELYITLEHDPRIGFRSSSRPALKGDLCVRTQTWQELMGLLDQWLERLTKDKAASESMVRPAGDEAPCGDIALRQVDAPADDSQRAAETGQTPPHSPIRT